MALDVNEMHFNFFSFSSKIFNLAFFLGKYIKMTIEYCFNVVFFTQVCLNILYFITKYDLEWPFSRKSLISLIYNEMPGKNLTVLDSLPILCIIMTFEVYRKR